MIDFSGGVDRKPSPIAANIDIIAANNGKSIHNATETATATIFAGADGSHSPLDSQQDEGIPWEIQRAGNDGKDFEWGYFNI